MCLIFILFFYQCFPNYISNNNNNTFNNFFFLLFANGLHLLPRTNVNGSHVTFPPGLLLFCSNPSTLWKQTYSFLTGANGHVPAPPMAAQSELSNGTGPDSRWTSSVKLSNLFTFCLCVCVFLLNVEVPNYIIKFTCFCCLCIVLYCFSSFLFWGALITSNYSFCLIFCFLLGCSCMLRCVVFVLCTVLLFTVSCLLGQFHVFCLLLFVFFCWAVSVRIERGP